MISTLLIPTIGVIVPVPSSSRRAPVPVIPAAGIVTSVVIVVVAIVSLGIGVG
jgi:hypothetical protein